MPPPSCSCTFHSLTAEPLPYFLILPLTPVNSAQVEGIQFTLDSSPI